MEKNTMVREISQIIGVIALMAFLVVGSVISDYKAEKKNKVATQAPSLHAGATLNNEEIMDKVEEETVSVEEYEKMMVSVSLQSNDVEYEQYEENLIPSVEHEGYISKESVDLKVTPDKDAMTYATYKFNTKITWAQKNDMWAMLFYHLEDEDRDVLAYIPLDSIMSKKYVEPEVIYSASYFRKHGSIYWDGRRWTYYSQRVLPGGGLKIPGRHVDENGYVCDSNNYIVGASQLLNKGTVIDSPFGKKVKIYDWCDIESVDIYTNW